MSKGTVWITRTNPGAKRSAIAWQKAGFETYINPLIEIALPSVMPTPLPDNAVLLVTSQHALRKLAMLTDRRDWPVLTVGEGTKNLATSQGFKDVIAARGNARDLMEMTQELYDPGEEHFVYTSGQQISFNPVPHLKKRGYNASREIYYENRIKTKVSLKKAPKITHIALYSALAARATRKYARRFPEAVTVSISQAAQDATIHKFKHSRVAQKPTEASMIKSALT